MLLNGLSKDFYIRDPWNQFNYTVCFKRFPIYGSGWPLKQSIYGITDRLNRVFTDTGGPFWTDL